VFSVSVRDHMMVAHSLRGAVFGPAQALHGATYVVDATFFGPTLDDDGILLDIGRASGALRAVVADLGYRNLDEDERFTGRNTTTEVLAQHVADRLAEEIGGAGLGLGDAGLADAGLADAGLGSGLVTRLTVTLHESHVARASYERGV
jgi:6-pyruvoyl-tetrahydropterin synthase